MAEYLIMAEHHWTHQVPEEQRADWSPAMWEMYNAAYERGDIVGVYEDGTITGINNRAFKGVRVRGEKVMPERTGDVLDEKDQLRKRRRFVVDLDALVPAGERIADVTETEFTKRLYDKAALMEQ